MKLLTDEEIDERRGKLLFLGKNLDQALRGARANGEVVDIVFEQAKLAKVYYDLLQEKGLARMVLGQNDIIKRAEPYLKDCKVFLKKIIEEHEKDSWDEKGELDTLLLDINKIINK